MPDDLSGTMCYCLFVIKFRKAAADGPKGPAAAALRNYLYEISYKKYPLDREKKKKNRILCGDNVEKENYFER